MFLGLLDGFGVTFTRSADLGTIVLLVKRQMVDALPGSGVDVALYHRIRGRQQNCVDPNVENLGSFGSDVGKRSRGRENSHNRHAGRSEPVVDGGTEELKHMFLVYDLRSAPALGLNDFDSFVFYTDEISTQILEAPKRSVVGDDPPIGLPEVAKISLVKSPDLPIRFRPCQVSIESKLITGLEW